MSHLRPDDSTPARRQPSARIALQVCLGLSASLASNAVAAEGFVLTGVQFQRETLHRAGGPRSGDNWNMTWAADGNQYTSCDDGWGWDGKASTLSHSSYYRIGGQPDSLTATKINDYPAEPMDYYFGYGTISVSGTLYQFLSRQPKATFSPPFQGTNLIRSPDLGAHWYHHSGQNISNQTLSPDAGSQLFWHDQGKTRDGKTGYAFAWTSCVQRGRDNAAANDDFVYVYAPEGTTPHQANLARVAKNSLADRSAYQFFQSHRSDGGANWTSNIANRGVVHTFPTADPNGIPTSWYSWLPNVVYNEPLGLYIMCTGATYHQNEFWGVGHDLHAHSGSLSLSYAKNPWGPWTQFHYDPHWRPESPDKTYLPTLSPKWISSDGKEMVLVWSDYHDNWYDNYRWNQMRITLTGVTGGGSGGNPPAPAARWTFDEGSGSTAADAIGNNHLSVSNSTGWTAGTVGTALALNGSTDAAAQNVSATLRPQSLTIAAWVRSSQSNAWAWVAAQGDNYGLVINRTGTSDDVFFYAYNGSAWPNVSSGDVNVCDGAWHHVAAILGNGRMRVFLDGKQVGDAPAPADIAYTTGNGFTVGSMKGQRRFSGAIDEVSVYPLALSSSAIAAIAAIPPTEPNPQPPVSNGPIAHWSLNDSQGSTATDVIGNHDLRLSSGATWSNGPREGALALNGSSDAAITSVSTALKPQELSIAAWVRSDQSTRWAWVAAQGDNYGLALNRHHTSDDVFFYIHGVDAWHHVSSGDVNVCDGAWHHVAATLGNGRMRVYLDGIRVGDTPAPTSGIDYSKGDEFTVGSMQGQRGLQGAVDEALLYNRRLDDSEIAQLAQKSVTPSSGGGGLLREVWLGIASTSLTVVPWSSAPDLSMIANTFEAPSHWNNEYATRMRGFLHPPSSGNYVFTIAGDDDCELWLSTNNQPSTALRIAGFQGWTSPREWNKFSGQRSATLSLAAGQAYYIEARHKEGRGGDHLAVAWEGPGITRQVIPRTALSPWTGSSPTPTLRILALGDSITQGDSAHQSYRYRLWTTLVDTGISSNFVGSQRNNYNGNPIWPSYTGFDFDRDHEGHWGWRADQIADALPGYLSNHTPDIVLLHAGTNDALQGQSTSSTLSDLARIIAALRADNPAVTILVAKPIPTANTSADARLVSLSNALDGFVADLHQPGAVVMAVDQRTGFSLVTDVYDGIHPNSNGEAKIAQRWFDAILQAIAKRRQLIANG